MRIVMFCLSISLIFLLPNSSLGEDHVVIMGGGPTLEMSQISIEHNVHFLLEVLDRMGSRARRHIHFASGPGTAMDVCQQMDSSTNRSAIYLTELFDRMGRMSASNMLDYRHHLIPNAMAATKAGVLGTLRRLAMSVNGSDRVFLFVTGHGSKGKQPENGFIDTWGREQISVRELGQALDAFPVETPVISVMVQCYAGSFAHLIFRGGDPGLGLAPHRRAGFFATTQDRPAAGCTPDTKIEDYKEYSTYFLAALGGRDRVGNTVVPKDLNSDGAIDASEAHAHTLVTSTTVDVSIRTSDCLLRALSRQDPNDSRLLTITSPFSKILESANPVERFVLEELSRELQLSGEDRIAQAEQLKKNRPDRPQMADGGRGRTPRGPGGPSSRAREEITRNLLAKWPFLRFPYHPKTIQLLHDQPDEVRRSIEAHPQFQAWRKEVEQFSARRNARFDQQKNLAKTERFLYLAESVVLRHNLPMFADAQTVKKLAEIDALEQFRLTTPSVSAR